MRAALLLVFAVPLVAEPAAAHLDPLAGRDPFVVAGALLGGSTSWGLVLQDADGTYRRVCEEALGASMLLAHRLPDGRVLAATLDGLLVSGDSGCSWDPVEGLLANLQIAALRAAHAAPDIVYASTSRVGAPNGVWKSIDGGAHFTETALAGTINPLLELAVADDGAALFVSGVDVDGERPLLRGSLDGGASFFDAAFDLSSLSRVRVLFVDDERVWLSILDGGDVPALASVDRGLLALRSEGAFGNDVTDVARLGSAGPLFALVRPGALYRRDSDGGWSLVDGVTLSCLRRVPGDARLWACTSSPKQFAVSADGVTFAPLLGADDVQERVCPAESYGALACPAPPAEPPPPKHPPSDAPPTPLAPPAPGGAEPAPTAREDPAADAQPVGCTGPRGGPLFAVLALVAWRRRSWALAPSAACAKGCR